MTINSHDAQLLELVDKAVEAINNLVIFGSNHIKAGGTITGWDAIIEGDFHLNCVQDSLRCRCRIGPEWSGSPSERDPDNFWTCDDCGREIAVDREPT